MFSHVGTKWKGTYNHAISVDEHENKRIPVEVVLELLQKCGILFHLRLDLSIVRGELTILGVQTDMLLGQNIVADKELLCWNQYLEEAVPLEARFTSISALLVLCEFFISS